jgi:hypothetical protein
MPEGTVRWVKQIITGLLVLAVLLFSGAQASMAMLPNAHHHDTNGASQTIAALNYGTPAPVHSDDCDEGLPCCIGGQCIMNAHWIPANVDRLPSLSKLGVVGLPDRTLSLNGIATQPASPPPRAIV